MEKSKPKHRRKPIQRRIREGQREWSRRHTIAISYTNTINLCPSVRLSVRLFVHCTFMFSIFHCHFFLCLNTSTCNGFFLNLWHLLLPLFSFCVCVKLSRQPLLCMRVFCMLISFDSVSCNISFIILYPSRIPCVSLEFSLSLTFLIKKISYLQKTNIIIIIIIQISKLFFCVALHFICEQKHSH